METLNTQFFFRDIFELDLQIGFEVFDTRMEAPCVIPTGSTTAAHVSATTFTGVTAIRCREVD